MRIGDYALPTTCYDAAESTSGVDLGTEACPFRSAWIDEINGAPLPSSGGVGDVVGPASATADAFALFDGTTGKLLKDSALLTSAFATSGHTHTTFAGLDFTGTGTGVAKIGPWASNDSWYALGLSGVVGASTYNLRSHPSTPHLEVNVPSGYEIRFRTADTIRAFVDAAGIHPASAGSGSVGKLGLGWSGFFVDSSSSSNTGAFVGGALTADRTYTTPDEDGTLALTSDIAATVDKAFVDALNVDADTLDGLDSTAFALAGSGVTDHTALSNLAWTSSGHTGTASRIAGFSGAGAASEFTTTGSGTVVALATSPTLTTPNIGAATGTSLNLASGGGSLSLATGQRIWFGGSGSGASIRQDVSANMQFNVSSTDVWRITAAGHIIPQGAFTLGIVNNGIPSIFLDEAGAGTQTAQLIAPTLSADIVLTTPDATGTLCRTDGDAIGSTTPASGKFTTLQRRGGTGTGYAGGSGTLHVDTTAVGNVGTGTDTLMSYTLPANTLATNGDWLRLTVTFTTAANGNNKNFDIRFGGTTAWTSGAQGYSGDVFNVTVTIVRTGASTQRIYTAYHQALVDVLASAQPIATTTTATETDTATITILGRAVGTSDNDAVQNLMLVEYGSLS